MIIRQIFLVLLLAAVVMIRPAAAEMDFSKAITIGSGPTTVVEFTDPDCPFCRKASRYFEDRQDVTRHVFFYPLARHPKAREKAQFILSMPDKASAYHDVMSGKMDSVPNLTVTAEGIRLQAQQNEIAKRSKVDATPTFMINGRIIEGFDVKRIEEVLGAKQ